MKKEKFSTKVLAEIAIFAALAFALDVLQGGIWKGVFINGGSIGLAMVPIFIISYRRGLLPGILCGFVLSIIQMLGSIYVINAKTLEGAFMQVMGPFIQVMLDYVLAYTVVGFTGAFAGLYSKGKTKGQRVLWIVVGCVIGGLLKYVCHILAGLWFWPGDLWGVSGAGYSFLYNGLYCIPNIFICTIIMVILTVAYPQFLNPNKTVEVEEEIVNEEANQE